MEKNRVQWIFRLTVAGNSQQEKSEIETRKSVRPNASILHGYGINQLEPSAMFTGKRDITLELSIKLFKYISLTMMWVQRLCLHPWHANSITTTYCTLLVVGNSSFEFLIRNAFLVRICVVVDEFRSELHFRLSLTNLYQYYLLSPQSPFIRSHAQYSFQQRYD